MSEKSKQKKGTQTVLWWVAWITLTILSFFAAHAIWTPLIARHFGSIRETKTAAIWVAAVFGTWMVFLVPLIVFMYHKVDKAYEDARNRRERAEKQFRSLNIEKEKRLLPEILSRKLAGVPETIEGGHLVSLTLKNGKHYAYAFIAHRHELLGLYDEKEFNFTGSDIQDIELVDMSKPPTFFAASWLRLDGVTL
ncbi:MAG: hypothetical protein H6757_03905 [Candidatus Omnitrophica bacterium]|nr:hypothetical protein [Candidatus Omnitrophota bacterium]